MFTSLKTPVVSASVSSPLISSFRSLSTLVLIASLTACGVDKLSPSESATPANTSSLEGNRGALVLKGSVGNGPVIGADITITDSSGELLALTTSDDTANYTVTIPGDAAFPITISATGGTDVVTGSPLGFSITSVALSANSSTSNINLFSTLIVKTAQAMPGGLNRTNLETAKQNILQNLNFGIDSRLIPDPIVTPVTERNVANIIKASVTFSETIRRTHATLLMMGESITENQLIEALAADMTDGYLDGIGGTSTNQLYSATTNVVSGQVLIEALSSNLHINGAWGNDLLDNAILVTMPAATVTTAGVAITSEMIVQAKLTVNAAQKSAPNESLSEIAIILDNLSPESNRDDIRALLTFDKSRDIKPAISNLAFLTDDEIASINIYYGKDNASDQDTALTLAWNPNSDSVLGYIVYYGSTPETAVKIASETSTTSVRLMRKIDLGLNPGDRICFRLKAYNNNSLSGYSGAACGRV